MARFRKPPWKYSSNISAIIKYGWFKLVLSVLTFLHWTRNLLCAMSVTHHIGAGAWITWNSTKDSRISRVAGFTSTTLTNTGNQMWWSERVLTLLVCSDAGLLVALHVHHDTALPVCLGVNRHLIACKMNTRTLLHCCRLKRKLWKTEDKCRN